MAQEGAPLSCRGMSVSQCGESGGGGREGEQSTGRRYVLWAAQGLGSSLTLDLQEGGAGWLWVQGLAECQGPSLGGATLPSALRVLASSPSSGGGAGKWGTRHLSGVRTHVTSLEAVEGPAGRSLTGGGGEGQPPVPNPEESEHPRWELGPPCPHEGIVVK